MVGHKNPDTDSVVSAYVWSKVLSRLGDKAIASIAGDTNKETELVFEKAGINMPKKLDVKEALLFLVDHNEAGQMAGNQENVIGILDHHNISDFSTDKAIYFRNEPLGSTSSLIFKVATEEGVDFDEKDIFLLLCGIISDTLKLTSPTTTEYDKRLVDSFAELLGEDVDELAKELFEAKSDLSDMSIKEIIKADYKDYEFSGKKLGVGVAEVVSISFFEEKENLITQKIKEIKKEKEVDHIFFAVIDVLNQSTLLFVSDQDDKKLAQEAFGVEDEPPFTLKGVSSRKKQIIPPISKILKK